MKKAFSILVFLIICLGAAAQDIVSVMGRVVDEDTNRPLSAASVNLDGTNISIITNRDGDFTLKMPANQAEGGNIVISFLGYVIKEIPVASFPGEDTPLTIKMTPMSLQLDPAIIKAIDPEVLFRTVFGRIKDNYPTEHVGMTTFYRELIRKDSNKYLVLNEAVVDVDKAPYNNYASDRASIYKGRGSINVSPSDTLFVKFQGGILSALAIDMAKHPFAGIDVFSATQEYQFSMGEIANIDDVPFYTLNFMGKHQLDDFQFKGTLFIDTESYAIARIEFGMDISDLNRDEAAKLFIVKMPTGMRFSMDHADYIVNYKKGGDGKWYFDYSKTDMGFYVRKVRSLFRHYYGITSEMAVTDHKEEALVIDSKERVRTNQILTDNIHYFEDPDFWEDYNIIQPDQTIQAAIQRIIRQLNRRR
ncbi:MAG: carboxypeptidase-like regulatory domain-containing protein [Bacteroidales bacterium]|nr:carboxypeptidase-like regulatory domain-containing protein [Bacteroidales bacterium]